MEDNNNNNSNSSILRTHVSPSSPPPSPPMVSFIAALAIAMLIFMCIYVFSTIVSVAIVLTLCIISVFLCRVIHNRRGLDTELRERTNFYAQTQQNNQRVVRIFDKLFWVVEERGNQRVIGSIVCFGSQAMASSNSNECAICLEDFKKGEECLVFSVCGHTFHFDCINHWIEKKPSCPICRQCIPSSMVTKTRSIEFLANLV
ncbi:putative RING-H2 finger protein ATL19 [Gastrolobium bilobum]|uniref:putative RING-H2 finger protein ATL19 n=1 Tax=Gastrolobium bilobum TaxID=150636 RepID=UPI002AB30B83|nr:putative RING-H2 finger protein ATL19 [Gastrolobium bilobum]